MVLCIKATMFSMTFFVLWGTSNYAVSASICDVSPTPRHNAGGTVNLTFVTISHDDDKNADVSAYSIGHNDVGAGSDAAVVTCHWGCCGQDADPCCPVPLAMKITLGVFLSACLLIFLALIIHGCWKMRSQRPRPFRPQRNQTMYFFTNDGGFGHSTAFPQRGEIRRAPIFRPVLNPDGSFSNGVTIPLTDFRSGFSPVSLSMSDDAAARTARSGRTTSFF